LSDYTKSTNFATKDSLSSGNPLKIVKGTEINTEFDNIQTAVATKTDNANANITGGSIVGITDLAVADGGTGASTATNARTNLSAAKSGANSDITSITGLTTALAPSQGGTGATTLTANNVVLGNGTSAVQFVAPGTNGNVLVSNGTTWTSGGAGVTSLNGQTGAVVTTSVDAIGSVLMVANSTASNYYSGQTIAGSSLYYQSAYTGTGTYNQFYSEGTESTFPNTRWGDNGVGLQSPMGALTKINTGNTGYTAPAGTTTLSGTWRFLSSVPARTSSYDSCSNRTTSRSFIGLAVRVS
jgi:hypothetical protein